MLPAHFLSRELLQIWSRSPGEAGPGGPPTLSPKHQEATNRSHRDSRQGGTSGVTTLFKNGLGTKLSLLSGVAFGAAPMCPMHTLGVGWGGVASAGPKGQGEAGGAAAPAVTLAKRRGTFPLHVQPPAPAQRTSPGHVPQGCCLVRAPL